jgi:hypothetical protein
MCYKCIEQALLVELPPLQLAAICPSLLNIHPVQEPGKWVLETQDGCDEITKENLEKLAEMTKTMLNEMGLSIVPWEFRVVTSSRWATEKLLNSALNNS